MFKRVGVFENHGALHGPWYITPLAVAWELLSFAGQLPRLRGSGELPACPSGPHATQQDRVELAPGPRFSGRGGSREAASYQPRAPPPTLTYHATLVVPRDENLVSISPPAFGGCNAFFWLLAVALIRWRKYRFVPLLAFIICNAFFGFLAFALIRFRLDGFRFSFFSFRFSAFVFSFPRFQLSFFVFSFRRGFKGRRPKNGIATKASLLRTTKHPAPHIQALQAPPRVRRHLEFGAIDLPTPIAASPRVSQRARMELKLFIED